MGPPEWRTRAFGCMRADAAANRRGRWRLQVSCGWTRPREDLPRQGVRRLHRVSVNNRCRFIYLPSPSPPLTRLCMCGRACRSQPWDYSVDFDNFKRACKMGFLLYFFQATCWSAAWIDDAGGSWTHMTSVRSSAAGRAHAARVRVSRAQTSYDLPLGILTIIYHLHFIDNYLNHTFWTVSVICTLYYVQIQFMTSFQRPRMRIFTHNNCTNPTLELLFCFVFLSTTLFCSPAHDEFWRGL